MDDLIGSTSKSVHDVIGSTSVSAVSAAKSSPLSGHLASLPPIASPSKFHSTTSGSILGSLPPIPMKYQVPPPPKGKAPEPPPETRSDHFENEADAAIGQSLYQTTIIFKQDIENTSRHQVSQDSKIYNVPALDGNLPMNQTFGEEVKVVKLGEKKKRKKGKKAKSKIVPVDDNADEVAVSKDENPILNSVQVDGNNEGVVVSRDESPILNSVKVDDNNEGAVVSKDENPDLQLVQIVKVDQQQQENQTSLEHLHVSSSKKFYVYMKYFIEMIICVLVGVGIVYLVKFTQSKTYTSSNSSAQGEIAIGNGDNSSSSTTSTVESASTSSSYSVTFGGGNAASPTPTSTNSTLSSIFSTITSPSRIQSTSVVNSLVRCSLFAPI